jgi:uncharacterized protein
VTPVAGTLGGALICLAAAGLLLALGRIAGISGILSRALAARAGDRAWRVAFLVGLPLRAWLATRATGDAHGFAIAAEPPLVLAAGLLVGFGTRLGNGCTSGHGVCGISRGARRSIAATVFMASAFATVFIVRHLVGGA